MWIKGGKTIIHKMWIKVAFLFVEPFPMETRISVLLLVCLYLSLVLQPEKLLQVQQQTLHVHSHEPGGHLLREASISHQLGKPSEKHRENRKSLPREHLIGCQMCQVVLTKSTKKVLRKNRENTEKVLKKYQEST